ncbi:sensor domain-containing diguanylate cyclase [Ectothiorhodospira lacustris]|nr:sensor domain-containing diguanylate cyclase [Ectothiorhodospira lacustris]
MGKTSQESTAPPPRCEAHYRLLVEQQNDLIVKVDTGGRFLYVSPGYCKTFGKREEDLIGQRFMPLVHPDDQAQTEAAMANLYRPPHRCYLEQRAMTQDGWRWFGWSDAALLDERGEVTAIIGAGRDIHDSKLAELQLLQTQRMLELALEAGGIGTYIADFTTGEVFADARYLAQIGYQPEEIAITDEWWRANVHPEDLAGFTEQTGEVIHGGLNVFTAEYRFRHRDGRWIWLQDHARVYERNPEGVAVAVSGLRIDIHRRKEAELRLAYHADHDPLTDLLNRRGMWHVIRGIQAQGQRGHRPNAIAILDLDFFKCVNDTYGHLVGDQLLQEVARVLSAGTREADWVARWGGEEFLILMPDTTLTQARGFIERLRRQIETTPFLIAQHSLSITISAGLASSHIEEHDSHEAFVSRADMALYAAKKAGRNQVCTEAAEAD